MEEKMQTTPKNGSFAAEDLEKRQQAFAFVVANQELEGVTLPPLVKDLLHDMALERISGALARERILAFYQVAPESGASHPQQEAIIAALSATRHMELELDPDLLGTPSVQAKPEEPMNEPTITPPQTAEEYARREKIFEFAIANQELEGGEIPQEAKVIIRAVAFGELDADIGEKKLKELIGFDEYENEEL